MGLRGTVPLPFIPFPSLPIPSRLLRYVPRGGGGGGAGAAAAPTRVPFATVVTDLGGAHPTWFDGDVDACFVPGAALEARRKGRCCCCLWSRGVELPARTNERGRDGEWRRQFGRSSSQHTCPSRAARGRASNEKGRRCILSSRIISSLRVDDIIMKTPHHIRPSRACARRSRAPTGSRPLPYTRRI